MRTIVMAFAVIGMIDVAVAGTAWKVPGWYQIQDDFFVPFLLEGPFDDENSCRATLTEANATVDDAVITCEYLNERPNWDQ